MCKNAQFNLWKVCETEFSVNFEFTHGIPIIDLPQATLRLHPHEAQGQHTSSHPARLP